MKLFQYGFLIAAGFFALLTWFEAKAEEGQAMPIGFMVPAACCLFSLVLAFIFSLVRMLT